MKKVNNLTLFTVKNDNEVYFDRSDKYALSKLLFYILKDTH